MPKIPKAAAVSRAEAPNHGCPTAQPLWGEPPCHTVPAQFLMWKTTSWGVLQRGCWGGEEGHHSHRPRSLCLLCCPPPHQPSMVLGRSHRPPVTLDSQRNVAALCRGGTPRRTTATISNSTTAMPLSQKTAFVCRDKLEASMRQWPSTQSPMSASWSRSGFRNQWMDSWSG